jgi:putative peptide zinc metalloprotease protein
MLTYWCARYIYRVPNPRAPSGAAGERALLTIFGVCSLFYRVLLFLTITLYVMGLFFGIGLFLAVWSLGMWFLLPAGKFVHWLATSSQLYDKRSRAVLTTLALLTLTTIALGVVRIPDWRRATGVVESDARTTVFFKADGFVDQVHVLPGQSVRAGDPIATLSSPELGSAILATRASIEEARVRRREAQSSDDAPSVQVVDRQIELYAAQLVELETRRENLILRAPQDGVIVSADPNRLIGALVRRGQPACGLVDTTKLHIAASVTQADASMLFALSAKDYAVELRPISRPRETPIPVDKVTPVDAGSRELVHAALGFTGGGDIATSASDQTGRTAQRGQFLVYLQSSDEHLAQLRPGERVRVRFTLPSRPLLSQFYERVQRLLQTKVNL